MTITFQGQITEVGPAIAGGYAVGEVAQLYVECAFQGSRSWYDITGDFPVLYSIEPFMQSTQALASVHFSWPWITYQEWQITKTITISPMPNQALSGMFMLWEGNSVVLMAAADDSLPQITQTQYPILLDSRAFSIPVKGGGGGGNLPSIPWKEIGIGLGIVGVVGLVISAAKR